MEDENLSREEKINLLKSANYHHEQNRIATAARGFDRHLFGLYVIAKVSKFVTIFSWMFTATQQISINDQ